MILDKIGADVRRDFVIPAIVARLKAPLGSGRFAPKYDIQGKRGCNEVYEQEIASIFAYITENTFIYVYFT